jgi:hypothetical protein
MTFKIEGLKKRPRWYDIKCTCDNSNIEKKFPIAECKHCQFQTQEDLMPRKSFDISIAILDKNGKATKKTKTVKCNKIKIVRGKRYEEILGWFNLG